ncbi:LysR family transcriptional regulator [Cupriavidus basilensis OR16]|uniref:LysR family transcriptional regulator n=1 Tax=Cupriavidus basilensis OR16 TaxID=1127483 RepID=H1SGZ6_9BURK|nr:LysR family transcriptional regulator [Cupriavidus basilensis OR16]
MYLIYPYASFYPAKLRRFVETMRRTVPATMVS